MNSAEDRNVHSAFRPRDVGKLQADLDSLAHEIAAGESIDASRLFGKAKLLLSRVKESPSLEAQESEIEPGGRTARWQAISTSGELGEQNVICWKEQPNEVVVEGDWRPVAGAGDKIHLLSVRVGDRVWAMRETEHGPSYVGPDEATEGSGDKSLFEELQQHASKQAREPAHPQSLAIGWICARCSFPNKEQPLCQMCHAPRTMASVLTGAQKKESAAQLPRLKALTKPGAELEGLPSWIDPRARFDGELDLPPGLQETVGELARWSGNAINLILGNKEGQQPHCVKCGAEILNSSHFCTKCGADQRSAPPPGPESIVRPPMATSGSEWRCAKCGEANPQPARFCMNCAAPGPHAPPSPENPRKR